MFLKNPVEIRRSDMHIRPIRRGALVGASREAAQEDTERRPASLRARLTYSRAVALHSHLIDGRHQ